MNKIFKTGLMLAAAAFICSCEDAEYGVGSPRAFLAESTTDAGINGTSVRVQPEGTDVTVTITLTDKVSENTSFRLVADESVLDTYNSEQSSGYVMLDASCYTLPSGSITIPAGEYSADPVTININTSALPEEAKGTPMALPIRLERAGGNVEVAPNTSKYVFAIPAVLTNDLAQFTGATGLHADNFNGNYAGAFTVEVRFQVSNTGNRNRDAFTNGQSVLLRFEDPQSLTGTVQAHSAVQFQGDGGYLNPDPLTGFATNAWQHLAVTWDGSTICLYYNGALVGTNQFASSVVGDGVFPSACWFGGASGGGHGVGSEWWTGCRIMFTEARIWSVCRTASQISSNISAVAADSEGLEGYWRINRSTYDEATGSFEDLTGNGHPLVTENSFVWNEGISSEDTSTPWVE